MGFVLYGDASVMYVIQMDIDVCDFVFVCVCVFEFLRLLFFIIKSI